MLTSGGFTTNTRIGIDFDINTDIQKLIDCFKIAEQFLDDVPSLKEVRFYYNLFYFYKLSLHFS